MLIYCVEDDQNIRELVLYTLNMAGYQSEGFAEGKSFFEMLSHAKPHLILLDVMLPGEDGITILKKLRNNPATEDIPVIMLTAKSSEMDKVVGLDTGADDYVVKPFGMMELLSRIKAVLRRYRVAEKAVILRCHAIEVDSEKHQVTAQGEVIDVTLKEFELLTYLMENQGIVLTRDQILENIWGYDFDGETRTVDVHVRSLRQKLGEQGQFIQTVRGVGYRMEDSNEA